MSYVLFMLSALLNVWSFNELKLVWLTQFIHKNLLTNNREILLVF